MIVRQGDQFHPFRLRQLPRGGESFFVFGLGVDVRVGEKHHHLVSLGFEPGHAGAGAGSATTMEQHFHFRRNRLSPRTIASVSRAIWGVIFDFPARRSVKTMGTSRMVAPAFHMR